ncbi:MAG: DUF2490 domain-containing protein [Bacteroidales bacterium]|nr:DUF2490 domain-containing protein [Bacteroidales bacterium]
MRLTVKLLSLAAALALPAVAASGQSTVSPLSSDFRTRTSLDLDWKLAKGLHLEAGYELRSESNLTRLDRHQASVGLSYKFADWLKAGASYTYIYHHRNSGEWTPRHRFSADVTFAYKAGLWRFSLKEQLRLTHKTESLNPYQEVRDPLMLKSRLKVQYKGWKPLEPYAYIEARNIFNDPSFSATWSTSSLAFADYEFGGYNDMYFNRFRGAIGLEWKVSKHSAFDFYTMLDYCYDKNLDVNKAGTFLKSLTYDQNLNTIVGIGYKFSF